MTSSSGTGNSTPFSVPRFRTSTERPNFGSKQVKSPEQLLIGKKFYTQDVHIGDGERIRITGEPFLQDGEWVVPVDFIDSVGFLDDEPGTLVLAHYSVVPYSDGTWHIGCYLEPAE